MKVYTLREIRDSYRQKKDWERQFPVNYYVVRPISLFLTFWILKITTHSGRVAAFGFVIGLAGLVCLSCASLFSVWPGIILIIIYSVLDAVDGNVARTTQNVTLFGKYLDGLFGDIIDGNYFLFLGLGCYFAGTALKDPLFSKIEADHPIALSLFLGAWIVISRLWASNFQTRYNIYLIRKEGSKPFSNGQIQEVIGRSTLSNRWYYLIFINIETLNNQLLLLVILAILKLEIWFLLLFALFYTIKAILFFFYYFFLTKSCLKDNSQSLSK